MGAEIWVANKVLHEARLEVSPMKVEWGNAENFIREWAMAIKSMIENAPTKRGKVHKRSLSDN